MTLEELKARLPAEAAQWAAVYGPTVLRMTAAQLAAWLDYVVVGRYSDAFNVYLTAAADDELLAEWDRQRATWAEANAANAARIELSRRAAQAACQVMLGVIIAVVGL